MKKQIPIIDLFAGPGGLGEGFSSLLHKKKSYYKIALSIEKDKEAHQTLLLRSFFRQFQNNVPNDYYLFLKGLISIEELYKRWPDHFAVAEEEAWNAALGEIDNKTVDTRIKKALFGYKEWVLIGGPPCQAYSIVGRVRRQQNVLDEAKDERVGLYKQYLRILAVHNPTVFIMENVKGLLSATTKDSPIFTKILNDLSNPTSAYIQEYEKNGVELSCPGYKIYSLVKKSKKLLSNGKPEFLPKDFVIHCEKYGIPQTRHRIILIGVRNDLNYIPKIISPQRSVALSKVLSSLPRLRSGITKVKDDPINWKSALRGILAKGISAKIDKKVLALIKRNLNKVSIPQHGRGGRYLPWTTSKPCYNSNWFLDKNIEGVCNHYSRMHMESDLLRYFFAACFAKVYKRSPNLSDFPHSLLPNHENVQDPNPAFVDRFKVQLINEPAKTITSHIAKDGHYYIHPDPTQCRSLTVREAARIQTFPDNYYFCGNITSQFTQVGNAVPPLLAQKIAVIVRDIFIRLQPSNLNTQTNGKKRKIYRRHSISVQGKWEFDKETRGGIHHQ